MFTSEIQKSNWQKLHIPILFNKKPQKPTTLSFISFFHISILLKKKTKTKNHNLTTHPCASHHYNFIFYILLSSPKCIVMTLIDLCSNGAPVEYTITDVALDPLTTTLPVAFEPLPESHKPYQQPLSLTSSQWEEKLIFNPVDFGQWFF